MDTFRTDRGNESVAAPASECRWVAACIAGLALFAGGSGLTREPHARAKLISEREALVPGEATALALTFEIDLGWHMYWNGQDGEGMAPEVTFTLPAGYTTGPLEWPPPHRLVEPGDVLSHVYEDRLTILVPVRTPKSAKPGDKVLVAGNVKWVICGSVCIPESAQVSLELPVRESALAKSADSKVIDTARAAMAKPLADAGGKVVARMDANRLIIESPGAVRMAFYPAAGCPPIPRLVQEGETRGGRLSIGFDGDEKDVVSGIVRVEAQGEASPRHFTIEVPMRAVSERKSDK